MRGRTAAVRRSRHCATHAVDKIVVVIDPALRELSRIQIAQRPVAGHPYVVHGRRARENPYYVPPLDRLGAVLLPDALPIAESNAPLG